MDAEDVSWFPTVVLRLSSQKVPSWLPKEKCKEALHLVCIRKVRGTELRFRWGSSCRYENGDRLSLEHEKFVLEKLLAYHPECEKKIGCGIDYITVGYHPDFEGSRCLFIVRNDGELVDFSYWKCIKGLIRKKYPQYADSFILRHFQRRYN
ncbi:Protein DCL-like, chloroplastic [Vitis vinifera]|uniref:Protein DCL-like, chloroplastic n=1 Tax=Vitis vinifera TaxID=29760 RepID=A0A438ITH5_VITVI|nr:Protein DCL-like, chloroplastic [Vitis vinifera]